MARSGLPAPMVGAVRAEQGWIGGTSPLDAVAVTPPPDRVPALMDDLVAFLDAPPPEIDPLTAASVGHAQFELIHPFADGNGRLGRVLLLWTLTRHLALLHPPPVSMVIERQRGAYLAGLQQFPAGDGGGVGPVVRGGDRRRRNARRRRPRPDRGARRRHASATASLRADSAARALVPHLPAHPVLTSASAAALVGVSPRAARDALAALAAAGRRRAHHAGGRRPRAAGGPVGRDGCVRRAANLMRSVASSS